MDDKELIWVEKGFAARYNAIESDSERYKTFEDFLKDVTESSRREFKANLEALEEDVAIYTGLMLKVKQAFRAAKDEALASSYALWEEYEKEIPKISKKVEGIVAALEPVNNATQAVSSTLAKLPVYQLEKAVDLMERISRLDDRTRNMVEAAINSDKEVAV